MTFRICNLKCSCVGGRWWVVYPVFALFVALSLWARTIWQPSMHEVGYALYPAICVFFATAFCMREASSYGGASSYVEPRSIGLLLLQIAIFVMALHGVGMSLGAASSEETEKTMAFSFYGSVAGLFWMTLYCVIAGTMALRKSLGSMNRLQQRD